MAKHDDNALFDDKDDFGEALNAAACGLEQFPYSAELMIRKADLLLATRQYPEALETLENAEKPIPITEVAKADTA